ncbi:hypothetical protein EDC04DRAFT_2610559 [Pisolithus marmoratus]|nr:hypothetical protein EDC04DRAFT_2610559 [Pisolithus marmoratus]
MESWQGSLVEPQQGHLLASQYLFPYLSLHFTLSNSNNAGVEQKPKVTRNSTQIPLPTKKPVKASSGDVAAEKLPSTKDPSEQKNGSAFEAHASGDNVQDEPRESCMKPNKSSKELPRMERLEDRLMEARSNDEAEAVVGMAQQVPSQSIEVKDHKPEVPSKLYTAQSELQEQPSSRAGGPLKSEHPQVLNGMVEVPYEVEDIDRAVELAMRQQDMPEELTQVTGWYSMVAT